MAYSLSGHPRIVGIDYGRKRIGVAVSDPLRMFATPFATCTPGEFARTLTTLNQDQGIERFVVGWPVDERDQESETTRMVRAFVEKLAASFPGIPIELRDERFTSIQAKEAILQSGARRKARQDRGRVDAAAAALILQDYLDNG